MIGALFQWRAGYNAEIRNLFKDERWNGSGGSYCQWLMATSCAFLDGTFGLIVTFLLVVKSSTVLDVLLNFAAAEFVVSLDEAAFEVCKLGFFGDSVKKATERITETPLPVVQVSVGKKGGPSVSLETNKAKKTLHRRSSFVDIFTKRGFKKSFKHAIIERVGLFAVFLGVMGGWGYVLSNQRNGTYAPQFVTVQFDDTVNPSLGTFSGQYRWDADSRAFVEQSKFNNDISRAFIYCRDERKWVFAPKTLWDKQKMCQETLQANSGLTYERDITESTGWAILEPQSEYFVGGGTKVSVTIPCQTHGDCGGKGRGTCDLGLCKCESDEYFGGHCEFHSNEVCPEIALDARFDQQFPGQRQTSTSYKYLKDFFFYNHPVYLNAETHDVVLFTGARWAVTHIEHLSKHKNVQSLQNIFDSRSDESGKRFQAHGIAHVDAMSEPVNIGKCAGSFVVRMVLTRSFNTP